MKKPAIYLREGVKWLVVVLVLGLSLLHIYGNKAVWAPLDAYCPFGGLESFWKWLTQGRFLDKTQPSNFALGAALLVTTLLFGGVFCGWICPLGTIQDGLHRLGRFLRLPQLKIAPKADKLLRWLRLPILLLILLQSFTLARLWFADYDPFRIIFGLHWISEPSSIVFWGWMIGGGFLALSLVIHRFWCRYLCPLGLVIQSLGMISWFRIRWKKSQCLGCDLCSRKCPLGLSVQNPKLNSTACNRCLNCITSCPSPKALEYRAPFGSGAGVAVMGVLFFAVILVGAQLIGWWSPKITTHPEDIKGWMTLGRIAETYHIPISKMKKELGLPINAKADTELRSFEKAVPGFEVDLIRKYVATKMGTPQIPQANAVRDPEEIRGTMTLAEVSEGWEMPLATLLEKLGLPQDVDTRAPIRNLESFGINGLKVKEAVRAILDDK